MKRREMVKENQDFQEIIHNHRFLTNECFTIYQKSYQQSYPQFGIAVKKVLAMLSVATKSKDKFVVL